MSNMAVARIQREFNHLMLDGQIEGCAIRVELYNNNWQELRAEIEGPTGTPYEGGKFKLKIKVPELYPFRPLKISFITRVWHPNISMSGAICRSMLKKDWSPAMTLRTALLSVQAVLSIADLNYPEEAYIARQLQNNEEKFLMIAKNWTFAYAGGPDAVPQFQAEIEQLRARNVPDYEARLLLSFSV